MRFKVYLNDSVSVPERKWYSRRCLPVISFSCQSFIYPKPHLFLATLKLSSNQLHPTGLRDRQRSRKRWGECKPNTTISTHTHTLVQARQTSLWSRKNSFGKHVTAELSCASTNPDRNYRGKSLCFDWKQRLFLSFSHFLFTNLYQSLEFQE